MHMKVSVVPAGAATLRVIDSPFLPLPVTPESPGTSTSGGFFCTEIATPYTVPGGSPGSGIGIGKSWNRPASGACKTATQYVVHGYGVAIGGVSNTSTVVFNA